MFPFQCLVLNTTGAVFNVFGLTRSLIGDWTLAVTMEIGCSKGEVVAFIILNVYCVYKYYCYGLNAIANA